MRAPQTTRSDRTLLLLLCLFGLASLLHFVHNAVYLSAYPNLPAWLTSGEVYAAWCGQTAVGVLGYWLYRRVSRAVGLAVIAMYGALGFGGLDHYVVAPVSAHSVVMNLTIVTEVTAATALLTFVALSALMATRRERRMA